VGRELCFQGGEGGRGQDVFDDVGITINVVNGDSGVLDEKEFPESVGANDLLGGNNSLWGQGVSGNDG